MKKLKLYKREMDFVVEQVSRNFPSINEQVESVCTILNFLVGAGVSTIIVSEFLQEIGINDFEENKSKYMDAFYKVIESHISK